MGLSLRKIGNSIRDVFDANTQSDQAKRVAQGQPRMYADQQKAAPRQSGVPYALPQRSTASRVFDQINPYDNGRTFKQATPTTDYSLGNQIYRSNKASILGSGRSTFGNVEGLAGLYDLAGKSEGQNRVTKLMRNTVNPTLDRIVKNENLSRPGYHGSQVANEAAIAYLTGGAASALSKSRFVAPVVSKIPTLSKSTGAGGKLLNYATKPSTVANVAQDTLIGSGQRSARGEDISAGTIGMDAGTSLAFQGALTGAGKVASKVVKNAPKVTSKVSGALESPTKRIDDLILQSQKAFDVETNPTRRKQISQGISDLIAEKRALKQQGGYNASRGKDPLANDAPQVGKTGKPKVSLNPTKEELKMGEALGMSKQDVIDAKIAESAPKVDTGPAPLDENGNLPHEPQATKQKPAPEPYQATGKPKKDPRVKALLQDISNARSSSTVEGSLTAASLQSKAKELGVTLDQGFIDRYQSGTLNGPNEVAMGDHIRSITDPQFTKQVNLNPETKYRQNYVPQSYKQDATAVEAAANRLQRDTNASSPRAFDTYQEAAKYGLTPEHNSLDKMIGSGTQATEQALRNKKTIQNGLDSGILTKSERGNVPITGMMAEDGSQIYAHKEVADVVNGVLQRDSSGLGRALNKTAAVASHALDVMLQGGIPGTNFNFFVFGQGVKDTTRNIGKGFLHPVQAVKQEMNLVGDIFRGKQGTIDRFAKPENQAFVREMADRGLAITPQTGMTGIGKNVVKRGWDTLGNNPTFGRYMPNRLLSTAQEVYTQSVAKGMSHEAALDLAAETTKAFTGHVDTIAKGRSNLTNDVAGVALFAPKYRESIIGALHNVVKSTYPNNWKDPKFAPSRQLLAGMAVTLGAYELLNRQITGHSMMENRPGQELSVEIPYGEKDEKGNQRVINVPFMPGFMTIPRAAVNTVLAVKRGDAKGVVKEASKSLSSIIQTGASVISNQDYFGRPIYNDQATADAEGIAPDNALQAAGKIATYTAGQFSPAWVRGVIDKVSGKPTEQAIATALEAPVRFGKRLNPETSAHFKDVDEIYGSLDKNGKAAWDTIHKKLKNVNGEYMTDKTVDSGLARASVYLDNPEVLEGDNEMARRAKARGQKIDPLFDLPADQQRIALRMDTLPPKDPNKTVLRKENPWLTDLSKARGKFFDSLPPGDPNKPKGPITYPEPTPEVAKLQDAYFQLEDSTMKRQMFTDNPELADQFAKEEQYSRAVRAMKDLPQYDKYPEPPKDVQNLMDFYTSMPKGEGANGKSPTRSAWIKSHPTEWAKMTEQFDKQALYNLQQDMQVAAFEGQDPTEKGIKSIASLAKSLGMSTGSGGFGSGGGSDPSLDPLKYAVSTKSTAKGPTISLKSSKAGRRVTLKAPTGAPKVSIRKSKV